jgi:hypothetical protein
MSYLLQTAATCVPFGSNSVKHLLRMLNKCIQIQSKKRFPSEVIERERQIKRWNVNHSFECTNLACRSKKQVGRKAEKDA